MLLSLDIETTSAVHNWLKLVGIEQGLLLRGIMGRHLNQGIDPGQVSRVFKSITVTAGLNPRQISGHSTRIVAAQDMLAEGASIGQIMAKVGWTKVDTVMRYVGINKLKASVSAGTKIQPA